MLWFAHVSGNDVRSVIKVTCICIILYEMSIMLKYNKKQWGMNGLAPTVYGTIIWILWGALYCIIYQ